MNPLLGLLVLGVAAIQSAAWCAGLLIDVAVRVALAG